MDNNNIKQIAGLCYNQQGVQTMDVKHSEMHTLHWICKQKVQRNVFHGKLHFSNWFVITFLLEL